MLNFRKKRMKAFTQEIEKVIKQDIESGIICRYCGNKISGNVYFCPKCGAKSEIRVEEERRFQETSFTIDSQEIFIRVMEHSTGQKLYGCIFHHPLNTAWTTPHSHPVDSLHIVFNGKISETKNTYTDNGQGITVYLINLKASQNIFKQENVVEVKVNSKVCGFLPILDASEWWEFIFSHKPINPKQYLSGYTRQCGNEYVKEACH